MNKWQKSRNFCVQPIPVLMENEESRRESDSPEAFSVPRLTSCRRFDTTPHMSLVQGPRGAGLDLLLQTQSTSPSEARGRWDDMNLLIKAHIV